MSFGESINIQGQFRKYAKKPLYKILEGSGTQRDLAPKKEASRRSKNPLGRSGLKGGPTQTDRPGGGAGHSPRVPNRLIFWNVPPPTLRSI
jgi:hypothetical protein